MRARGLALACTAVLAGCIDEAAPAIEAPPVGEADYRVSIVDSMTDGLLDEGMGGEMPPTEPDRGIADAVARDAMVVDEGPPMVDAAPECFSREFQCADGVCIPETWVCNGVIDCADEDDENDCVDAFIPDRPDPDAALAQDAAPRPPDAAFQPVFVSGVAQNSMISGNAGGGVRFDDVCPAGQVMIGFDGGIRGGSTYLGVLSVVCGRLGETVNGLTINNGMAFPLRGGDGNGGGIAQRCRAGEVVVGYGGRAGRLVDQLYLSCAPVVQNGDRVLTGPAQALAPAGGQGGEPFAPVNCPIDTLAVGGIIRAGDGIDAVGLICAPITIRP